MDTSKEYIEKRIKAIPLMGKGDSPRMPATLFVYYDSFSVMVDAFGVFFIQDNTNQYICILERQDQLQGMVKSEYECDYDMNLDFTEFTTNLYTHEQIGASMEQFWLAFVMHEKFQKKWDGEDWIGI